MSRVAPYFFLTLQILAKILAKIVRSSQTFTSLALEDRQIGTFNRKGHETCIPVIRARGWIWPAEE